MATQSQPAGRLSYKMLAGLAGGVVAAAVVATLRTEFPVLAAEIDLDALKLGVSELVVAAAGAGAAYFKKDRA